MLLHITISRMLHICTVRVSIFGFISSMNVHELHAITVMIRCRIAHCTVLIYIAICNASKLAPCMMENSDSFGIIEEAM